MKRQWLLFFSTFITLAITGFAARNEFQTPAFGCSCVGDVLTFTCTVTGANSITIWRGSICQGMEILLRHSNFVNSGDCNSDNIHTVAAGVRVESDCYISQMNVTVSPEVDNQTVECAYSNLTDIFIVNVSTISLNTDPPSPNGFQLANVTSQALIFTWDMTIQQCSQLEYIFKTNCSTLLCENRTDSTSTTCSNLNPTDTKTCKFSIQTVVCSSILSSEITEISVILKVPQITDVKTVPVYLQSNGTLTRISITFKQPSPFMIADGFSGSPSSYKISYTNTSNHCGSAVLTPVSCQSDICTHTVNISEISCRFLNNQLAIEVSAINQLGEGLPSIPIAIDLSNKLVDIRYDAVSSDIVCTFKSFGNGEKTCNITYGKCDGSEAFHTEGVPTDDGKIRIRLQFLRQSCYSVIASNGNSTVIIEGTINADPQKSDVIAIVLSVLAVTIIIIVAVVIIIVCVVYKRKIQQKFYTLPCLVSRRLKNLQDVTGRFEVIPNNGDQDCTILDFLKEIKGRPVARGCSYFEFTKQEDIANSKEVILMHKKTKTFFKANNRNIIMRGTNVQPPHCYDDYAVFVQSYCGDMKRGSKRMILRNEQILYEDPTPSCLGLKHLDSNQIESWSVETGERNLEKLVKRRLDTDYNPKCVFFEFSHCATITKIVVKDKTTDNYYIAEDNSSVLKMIGAPGERARPPDLLRWNVFIQNTSRTCLKHRETTLYIKGLADNSQV